MGNQHSHPIKTISISSLPSKKTSETIPSTVETIASQSSLSNFSTSSSTSSSQSISSSSSFSLLNAIVKGDTKVCEDLLTKKCNENRLTNGNRLECIKHEYFPGEYTLEFINHTNLPKTLHAAALHVACMSRRQNILHLLLQKGVDANARDLAGRTPIHMIIAYWPQVLPQDGNHLMNSNEINYYNYFKNLHLNSKECLIKLCNSGGDINATVNNWTKETALHIACRHNKVSSIDVLIKLGASANGKDAEGRTPVMVAARQGSFETIEKLMLLGVNLSEIDNLGMNILHLLCGLRTIVRPNIISKLIHLGVNPNCQNNRGNTPLHIAAAAGNESAIDSLLNNGADPNFLNLVFQNALFVILDRIINYDKKYGIYRLLQETSYIRLKDASNNEPLLFSLQEMSELKILLKEAVSQPPLLQILCRHIIRRALFSNRITTNYLDLKNYPKRLKDFISQNDDNRFDAWYNKFSK